MWISDRDWIRQNFKYNLSFFLRSFVNMSPKFQKIMIIDTYLVLTKISKAKFVSYILAWNEIETSEFATSSYKKIYR